jgi:hypothetical protein
MFSGRPNKVASALKIIGFIELGPMRLALPEPPLLEDPKILGDHFLVTQQIVDLERLQNVASSVSFVPTQWAPGLIG